VERRRPCRRSGRGDASGPDRLTHASVDAPERKHVRRALPGSWKELSTRGLTRALVDTGRTPGRRLERAIGAATVGRPMCDTLDTAGIDARLDRIGAHHFRARFHLRYGRDRALVELRGMEAVRRHAEEIIGKRLAPAAPKKDGRQTPYRGHPVFVAQHATATCCRKCLERWHEIPRGDELTAGERAYVVEVICRWIAREIAAGVRRGG
jgi:hypothetical protein